MKDLTTRQKEILDLIKDHLKDKGFPPTSADISRTFVEGRLKSRQWDGQDGQTRYRNEIIASRVLFLDRNPAQNSENEPSTFESGDSNNYNFSDTPADKPIETDDLPF